MPKGTTWELLNAAFTDAIDAIAYFYRKYIRKDKEDPDVHRCKTCGEIIYTTKRK